ncbi:lecithin retinol acyltransferase domain-containing protein [Ditylenchus destructor]|uniref:Lecithin retinol acyltransferase domain-containing protein n=1 Tax=Ditylenchus destructor TaxID=166010 RepID=A0AAD4NBF8_9BILA|nr:lecithin retinol acyltransferase domain-containing protein [Ditylenchus destructor]
MLLFPYCILWLLLSLLIDSTDGRKGHAKHIIDGPKAGQQCTFREEVGTGHPNIKPNGKKVGKGGAKRSKKSYNRELVSEWRQGKDITQLLKPGDLMEGKHSHGIHWMIYIGGPKLEYIHTSNAVGPSPNWTTVVKNSLLDTAGRWMIRKNNSLDAIYSHFSSKAVVKRAKSQLGCDRVPFSYSKNNCQHFVNSQRYDVWESEIGKHRNSCQRNTTPWRSVIASAFPKRNSDRLFSVGGRKGKSEKQALINIHLYGQLPEDMYTAYHPMVKLSKGHKSKRNTPMKEVSIHWSSPANKTVAKLLETIKDRVMRLHSKNKIFRALPKEKQQSVTDALVVLEWNRLTRELYSAILTKFPDDVNAGLNPVNIHDGGAIECYRDWDLDYFDKHLRRYIAHIVKSQPAKYLLASQRKYIKYHIS